ncbi:MAG: YgjP-like metallopeptidase domain-containing protein [Comamonas sp.]
MRKKSVPAVSGDGCVPMALPYLAGYASSLQNKARAWLQAGKAGQWLLQKYPAAHAMRNDKALYDYVDGLKSEHLRNAGLLHKVAYDSKIHVVRNALGLHTRRVIAHGSKLNARHEIHVASMFKQTPEAFLRMICVHELAHLRVMDHDKAFYQLCTHMAPDYHQLEFDVRLYLSHLDQGGEPLWGAPADVPA